MSQDAHLGGAGKGAVQAHWKKRPEVADLEVGNAGGKHKRNHNKIDHSYGRVELESTLRTVREKHAQ